jgi:putative phosphoribosyl transferase
VWGANSVAALPSRPKPPRTTRSGVAAPTAGGRDIESSSRLADRREAGRLLAAELADVQGQNLVVYGIPRGGVVVAHEVAERLDCPLDVLIVRKLGYPGHEEAAFGALGEDGALAPEALAHLRPHDRGYDVVQEGLARKKLEVEEQIRLFRGDRRRRSAAGATAIVVDDGIATGYTFAAALEIVRRDRPRSLIAAVPVATVDGVRLVSGYCDEVRLLRAPEQGRFFAVSLHYDGFGQVDDREVVELLASRP